MKHLWIIFLLALTSCAYQRSEDPLVAIQIQDRNGLTETINAPERLEIYEKADFLSSQPYKKVLRMYKREGKHSGKMTTYYPSGSIWQYLEIEEMRAHGTYREWHPNGQLKIEAFVLGGTADLAAGAQHDWLFDGMSRVWDEQGHLLAQIPYAKGVMEGISSYFYPSGQIEKEISYHQNALDGPFLEFHRNGALKSKAEYRKGMKQGPSFGYFSDQAPMWVEEFTDGLLLKGAYYSKDHQILSEVDKGWGIRVLFEEEIPVAMEEIQRGQPEGLVKRFTPKGTLLGVYHTKGGKKHGEEIEYFEGDEKRPKISLQWNQDTIHGTVRTWYDHGQLQSQKEYCHNILSGLACAWYCNGSLMFLEEYEEGSLIKGQYYKKGQKEPTSLISNGNGTAMLYDEEGVFLNKVLYAKGKPVTPES